MTNLRALAQKYVQDGYLIISGTDVFVAVANDELAVQVIAAALREVQENQHE